MTNLPEHLADPPMMEDDALGPQTDAAEQLGQHVLTVAGKAQTGPDAEPNWPAGALDAKMGPALAAIHSQPEFGRERRITRCSGILWISDPFTVDRVPGDLASDRLATSACFGQLEPTLVIVSLPVTLGQAGVTRIIQLIVLAAVVPVLPNVGRLGSVS